MLENTVPILYYSPSIIKQLYESINGKLINSETQTKKSSVDTSIKAMIENLFIPVKGEASLDYERSKEKSIEIIHDDLSRTSEIIKTIQDDYVIENALTENNLSDALILLQGKFDIELRHSLIDRTNMVHLKHIAGNYTVHGVTSVDNWTSKSLVNQILLRQELIAKALVIPLSINEYLVEAKFACIFIS